MSSLIARFRVKRTLIIYLLVVSAILGLLALRYAGPYKKVYTPIEKIYVINLDSSKDRLAKISEALTKQGLEFTRFPAIDGLKLKIVDKETNTSFTGQDLLDGKQEFMVGKSYHVFCGNVTLEYRARSMLRRRWDIVRNAYLTPGELGCYCSHLELMHEISKSKHKAVLVLEDDAKFPDDFAVKLKELAANMIEDKHWDLIYLYSSAHYNPIKRLLKFRPILSNDILSLIGNINWDVLGFVALVYGQQGASSMLKQSLITSVPIDERMSISVIDGKTKALISRNSFFKKHINEKHMSEIDNRGVRNRYSLSSIYRYLQQTIFGNKTRNI